MMGKKKLNTIEIQKFFTNYFNLPSNLKDKNTIRIKSEEEGREDVLVHSFSGYIDFVKNNPKYNQPPHLNNLLNGINKNRNLFIPDYNGDLDQPSPHASIVSSVHGNIEKVLMILPTYTKDSSPIYIQIILDLMQQMEEVDFYIFTPIDPYAPKPPISNTLIRPYYDLKLLLQATRHRNGDIYFINPKKERGISFWAQDPFVALKEATNSFYLIEPYKFLQDRSIDETIANDIEEASKQLNIIQSQVELYFEGGNILIGDHFILIGKDYIEATLLYLEPILPQLLKALHISTNDPSTNKPLEKEKQIAKLFQFVFDRNKEVIIVGSNNPIPIANLKTCDSYQVDKDVIIKNIGGICHQLYYHKGKYQPFVHLDLFITLVGRKKPDKPYVVLVGELDNISDFQSPVFMNQYFLPLAKQLDDIASFLSQLKDKNNRVRFEVKRIPMPYTYIKENEKLYFWRHLSYNNCMIENSTTKRNVYFPTYGSPVGMTGDIAKINSYSKLKLFDAYIEKIWTALDFKSYPLINYLPLMTIGGAAHCVVKCLSRKDELIV